MLQADSASVAWNGDKKRWEVRVQVGAEVVRRPLTGVAERAEPNVLKSKAIEVAADEGYALDVGHVSLAA